MAGRSVVHLCCVCVCWNVGYRPSDAEDEDSVVVCLPGYMLGYKSAVVYADRQAWLQIGNLLCVCSPDLVPLSMCDSQ